MSLSLLVVDSSSLVAASSFATINQRKTNETNVSFMMMRARVGGNVVATHKITMNDGWLR
jgi:hypothetical protein